MPMVPEVTARVGYSGELGISVRPINSRVGTGAPACAGERSSPMLVPEAIFQGPRKLAREVVMRPAKSIAVIQ